MTVSDRMMIFVTLLSLAASHESRETALDNTVSDNTRSCVEDEGTDSLFLSPLIKDGLIKEAQERSRVENLTDDNIASYSGYLTVNEQYCSNMFFWFFPAQSDDDEAPVLLWLNGGPGRTSLMGALMENGPLEVTREGKLKRRKVSWTQHFSMLYVDSPLYQPAALVNALSSYARRPENGVVPEYLLSGRIGETGDNKISQTIVCQSRPFLPTVDVGYSFTRNDAGLSTSMADVAGNLYSVLVQFFKLFPKYSKNDFYIGGQSYAGKYVPALGYYIHTKNNDDSPSHDSFINLKGVYIGAGFCDPENMMPVLPDFLYNVGALSDNIRRLLRQNITRIIDESMSGKIFELWDYLNHFIIIPIFLEGGLDSTDNLIGSEETNTHLMRPLADFMNSSEARLKLHVGYARVPKVWIELISSSPAQNSFKTELMTNTSKENAFLMDNYKVLHYSGNLDVVVNVPMTEAFLDRVEWSGQEQYRQSDRQQWKMDGKLAGWVTVVGNFTRVIVRNSGHMVPYDQPEAALDMMKRFIFGEPF